MSVGKVRGGMVEWEEIASDHLGSHSQKPCCIHRCVSLIGPSSLSVCLSRSSTLINVSGIWQDSNVHLQYFLLHINSQCLETP